MARKNHKNTGLENGRLNSCPDLYNCVCSQYPDQKRHFEAPWEYQVSKAEMMDELKRVLNNEGNATLVIHDEHYLHAEFKVPVFGFIDDVEFYLSEDESLIHFRSASRLGTWDFGLNKIRMKKIKSQIESGYLK